MTQQALISAEAAKAVEKCIERFIPFVLYAEPGRAVCRFHASENTRRVSAETYFDKGAPGDFAISFFEDSGNCIVIPDDLSVNDVLSSDLYGEAPRIAPSLNSTDKNMYISKVSSLISEMRLDRSKTVVSRLISMQGVSPVIAAEKYFSLFDRTFRYLYYTPETGLWIGATPELLCDFNPDNNSLDTMSLAGTRPAGSAGEWDRKNIDEHNYVTDFIRKILLEECAEVSVGEPFSMLYGKIEHLCERIKAKGINNPGKIVSRLSPTPAVCGTPKELAMCRIGDTESHSRYCYGGWLGIIDRQHTTCYVNLRCAFAGYNSSGTYTYNIYAGGGVTGDSVASTEWDETEAKASALVQCCKIH